jgi:hypothetical protein
VIPAREVLTVFIDGEERSGIALYALLPSGSGSALALPDLQWPTSDTHEFCLHGEAWEVVGWDVALDVWPQGAQWTDFIRQALDGLVRRGAVVAWVGAEGFVVADPPDLFSPDAMTGSVLAAMTARGIFLCPTESDLPVSPLEDDELLLLRQHARGLADAAA